NETSGRAIVPTPIVGVVGVLEDASRLATQWFRGAGHRIALLGPDEVSLGGSEYLWVFHRTVAGMLAPLDLSVERRVQAAVQAAIGAGLALSAHDCSGAGVDRGDGQPVYGGANGSGAVRRRAVPGRRVRRSGAGAGVRGADGRVGDSVAVDRSDWRREAQGEAGRDHGRRRRSPWAPARV